MNNIQSVIVYRNPIEAAFWNTPGLAFSVIFGLILSVAVAVSLALLFEVYNRFRGFRSFVTPAWQANTIAGSAIVTMLGTVFYFA